MLNNNNHRLTLKGNLNYEFDFDNSLILSEGALDVPVLGASTFRQGIYDVASNVVIPDFAFYQLNTFIYKIEANFSFPLTFKKTKMAAFTKLYFQNTVSDSNSFGSRMYTGISFGIIP